MRLRSVTLALCCGALAVGCGDGIDEGAAQRSSPRGTIDGIPLHTADTIETTTSTTEPDADLDPGPYDTLPEPDDSPFGWTDYGDGVQDGTLEVPIDYDFPDGETITLSLSRHLAVDQEHRIGTLLVNPGGPGYGGTGLAWSAESIYGQDVLDRFDIVGWDPRGTGGSDPSVDCIDEYDPTFGIDSSPDTAIEVQRLTDAAQAFADDCERLNGDLLPHLSTMSSARDMNAIREALGEETISYFGFSYGSELGATWATMFPDTVRAAVLDGAVDPTVGYFEQNVQQAAGFEAALTRFLAACSASPECAFHHDGDAEGAFDLLARLVDQSQPYDGRSITQGVFHTAVASAMYDEASWPRLEQALADAEAGDWSGINTFYEDYYELDPDGVNYSNALEAYFAVNCLDDPGVTSIDELLARQGELATAAPRLGRSWMLELAVCAVWPDRPTGRITITGAGAGPILVVGTTGDSATPLQGTRTMATTLEDGHLVVVDANQHTGYGVNRCVDEAVDSYLVDPDASLAGEIDCR